MNNLHQSGPDDYLTPPDLIKALGRFDLDPACPPWMPWETADRMLSLSPLEHWKTLEESEEGKLPMPAGYEDGPTMVAGRTFLPMRASGLSYSWAGKRVWMNHPYSLGLPWAQVERSGDFFLCCGASACAARNSECSAPVVLYTQLI